MWHTVLVHNLGLVAGGPASVYRRSPIARLSYYFGIVQPRLNFPHCGQPVVTDVVPSNPAVPVLFFSEGSALVTDFRF